MGTSSSSKGPGKGVPFDPPWLNDIPNPNQQPFDPDTTTPTPGQEPIEPSDNPEDKEILLAPAARFHGARINLSNYIKTGDSKQLGRALGHYVKTGMGGATSFTRRMRMSSQTAAGLFNFLNAVSSRATPEIEVWVNSLVKSGVKAYDIAEEIVTKVGPIGGSLDETSAQNSMILAFEDLLNMGADVDLLNLDRAHVWQLITFFLGHELFNRIYLDIGQRFENSPESPQQIESIKDEIREYIMADIAVCIEAERRKDGTFTETQMSEIFSKVLQRTFEIFEGYLDENS